MKYGKATIGQVEAVWNKLGGEKGVQCFLAGNSEVVVKNHLSIAPKPVKWVIDPDGDIHFNVTSNGLTPEQWEQHLLSRDFRLSGYARNVLRRAREAPTNGEVYHIVVRPGSKIDSFYLVTEKIRVAAERKGWLTPHWEVACLIRDTFTDEQLKVMGLCYIVTMHNPIKDFSSGNQDLLFSYLLDDGLWLLSYSVGHDYSWDYEGGFAFVVPQVGSKHWGSQRYGALDI